jgi:long-chain fatty acid transport protein
VALTYGSESKHSLSSTETTAVFPVALHSTTDVTMPQSVNLDFQTGLNANTLLYGSVRWVNWKDWTVAPEGFQAISGGDLVKFDSNAMTYRLGLGRQFTDAFAGAIEVTYETAKHDNMTPLVTYDGYTAVSVGGTYTLASGVDLGAGLAYDFLGDTDVDANGVTARFRDNHAIAAAFRIGYRF